MPLPPSKENAIQQTLEGVNCMESGENRDHFLATHDILRDPLYAQNWSLVRKLFSTAHLALTTLCCTVASAAFSPSVDVVAHEFGGSHMVLTLGTSFFVLGFATGPSFWAPLCELKGRKIPLVLAMFGFCTFEIGTAVACNIETVLVCRLFGGIFAAGPMSVTAATLSDIWSAQTRGTAISCFSMSVFIGPFLAPILGSYVMQSSWGWRGTHFILSVAGGISCITLLIALRESYTPILRHEQISFSLKDVLHGAFIYGIIYLLLPAYSIVFNEIHSMDLATTSLPFLGLVVGMILGGLFVVCHQPSYARRLKENKGVPVPEWRLFPSMYGCIIFAGGIFWFSWTGYTHTIHWAFPTASGLMTGFGLFTIFLPCLNYLIDSYFEMSASAVAANTVLRSLAGAGFPLFASQMLHNMGVQWACTLLGCIATLLAPIPFILFAFGRFIRTRSRNASKQ